MLITYNNFYLKLQKYNSAIILKSIKKKQRGITYHGGGKFIIWTPYKNKYFESGVAYIIEGGRLSQREAHLSWQEVFLSEPFL